MISADLISRHPKTLATRVYPSDNFWSIRRRTEQLGENDCIDPSGQQKPHSIAQERRAAFNKYDAVAHRTALAGLPYHQHPVADRDEHGSDAWIARYRSIQLLNGCRLLIRRRLFQHIPVPQDVIDQHHSLRR